MRRLGAIRHDLWIWWWELPGGHWWFPDPFLGHPMIWGTSQGWRSPCAWPGIARCLFWPHADDSYGNCCYCGKSRRPGRGRWA